VVEVVVKRTSSTKTVEIQFDGFNMSPASWCVSNPSNWIPLSLLIMCPTLSLPSLLPLKCSQASHRRPCYLAEDVTKDPNPNLKFAVFSIGDVFGK
jgi:hypothetical protein